MPCKCSGYRLEKCRCKLVGPALPVSSVDGQVMFLTPKDSGFFKPPRYCPFRGHVGSENCFGEALKDLMVLACFVVANLVVFATIVTRMTVHVSFVVAGVVSWIKRSLANKVQSSTNETGSLGLRNRHDFSPPAFRT
ncbi:unnamed protein product [Diatraea saccharalis]|uniref:Uncharacterized protein n=1 Tax=Diatraea saccharalis TaxID=40085 RepID=A0A9N9MZT1_9NEOP|nr:unnamed protein product [Diatraea saccharalis]